jgi:hypothetical protein
MDFIKLLNYKISYKFCLKFNLFINFFNKIKIKKYYKKNYYKTAENLALLNPVLSKIIHINWRTFINYIYSETKIFLYQIIKFSRFLYFL